MRAVFVAVGALLAVGACAQLYKPPTGAVPGESRVAASAAGKDVRVDQRLGEYVPLDARFTDDDGSAVRLGDVVRDKPVVMLPVFYRCPGICAREFAAIAASLAGFKKAVLGEDFEFVVIGIDPGETHKMAAAKKDEVISQVLGGRASHERRTVAEKGTHFLTGEIAEIRKVTDALGFQYTYDEKSGNIVHPQGLMVVSPAGQISQYFLGDDYPQQLLLDSIEKARKNGIGYKDDRPFFLACVQVDPLTGQRSINILNTVRTLGVATVIGILIAVVYSVRKYKTPGGVK